MKQLGVDKIFLTLLIILSVLGIFIFTSASMGLLTENVNQFKMTIIKQVMQGLVLGWIFLYTSSRIDYKNWNSASKYIYIGSLILALCVFIPGVGLEAGGAKRWIILGPVNFQPSEIIKLGFVLFYASFLAYTKDRIKTFKYGLLPSILILLLPVIIILQQHDTGTLLSIIAAGLAMFIVAGGRWRHFIALIGLVVLMVVVVIYIKPYAMERIKTFLDPSRDPQGAGYQLRQSLIAIGSGKLTGRGFGQSIQKFTFLPEATSDAIFAVAGEEFGFIGSSAIVILFLFFGLRGLRIANQTHENYGRLTTVGLMTLVIWQSFINMGAMLGIVPLTGVPLIFLSHGGTALFITLFEMGIILNISKHIKHQNTETQRISA
ncbi:MAG: putative peptidoglycan glycosyltransferase FtsW [bacterium]